MRGEFNLRGQQRLAVLQHAAADVLAEQGWTALTHRALATRAGVGLGSTTYYFPSAEQLLVAGATQFAEQHLAASRALLAQVPDRRRSASSAARLVADLVLGADATSPALTAFYERYVRAGQTPELRALVIRWNTELRSLVQQGLDRSGHRVDERRARLLIAALDGLVVSALAEDDADPVASAVRGITALLGPPA